MKEAVIHFATAIKKQFRTKVRRPEAMLYYK